MQVAVCLKQSVVSAFPQITQMTLPPGADVHRLADVTLAVHQVVQAVNSDEGLHLLTDLSVRRAIPDVADCRNGFPTIQAQADFSWLRLRHLVNSFPSISASYQRATSVKMSDAQSDLEINR